MYKKLRIICSIVAALLTAACPFIFLYAGNNWGICSIGGILVFFFMMLTFKKLQEEKEGVTGISVRTSENYDPAAICAHFGGGGHVRAAGCEIKGTVAQAEKAIKKYITEVRS